MKRASPIEVLGAETLDTKIALFTIKNYEPPYLFFEALEIIPVLLFRFFSLNLLFEEVLSFYLLFERKISDVLAYT